MFELIMIIILIGFVIIVVYAFVDDYKPGGPRDYKTYYEGKKIGKKSYNDMIRDVRRKK